VLSIMEEPCGGVVFVAHCDLLYADGKRNVALVLLCYLGVFIIGESFFWKERKERLHLPLCFPHPLGVVFG
jgi:hypothetical protein